MTLMNFAMGFLICLYVINALISFVCADYSCVCNYNVEKAVYSSADNTSPPIGYLYEFDCKPTATVHGSTTNTFIAIQFEKQLGYVEKDEQVETQTCPGNPGPDDLVLTTTNTHRPVTSAHTNRHSTTTVAQATTSKPSTIQRTTATPTTTVTISTTRQPTTITLTTKATTPVTTQRSTTQTTTVPTTTTERTIPSTTTRPTTQTTTMPSTTTERTTTTRTTTPTTTMPTTTTIKPTTVITWPVGTYGLMKTASGCPGAHVTWHSGWRAYDTQDLSEHNRFSNAITHYLAGSFSHNIRTDFCMKTTLGNSQFDSSWPNGAYCILKKGNCPTGFHSGYIYWDDEDIRNSNHHGGILPDGEYGKNTKMYYCCRNDGQTSNPISLPVDRPFVLVRYGRTCQTVHGMNVHDLFVRWDDENILNDDDTGGMHPYDDGGSKNHQLHFCYYQSAGPGVIG